MSSDEFRDRFREAAEENLREEMGGGGGGESNQPTADSGDDDGIQVQSGVGRAFIENMAESGNVVMQNPFGEPVVEIITPVELQDRVEDLIEEWDLNPRGHGVIGQQPSFSEQRPQVSKDLVGWQFMLEEGEEDDLKSCGFDLETILNELGDEPVMATKANRVQASLPIE